jgi:hypothetical protein
MHRAISSRQIVSPSRIQWSPCQYVAIAKWFGALSGALRLTEHHQMPQRPITIAPSNMPIFLVEIAKILGEYPYR